MFSNSKKYSLFFLIVLVSISAIFFRIKSETPAITVTPTMAVTPAPTFTPARIPKIIPIEDSPLKDSVIAAGDYLARQQLANGELPYQVDFMTGERAYSPSYIRLIAGTGSLYTVCRVSDDSKYCSAGDLALKHYLEFLVSDPENFKGICLYTEGSCQLSGSALTVDAIYKRWQATNNFFLKEDNLLNKAIDLGYFIVSLRKPEGGFYQSYDPHFAGTVDPDKFESFSQSEALLAIMELYEMTGNDFWLAQAREVNAYLIAQPVTEDHWHGYALSMLARLDHINTLDKEYGIAIAKIIIAGQVRSLDPKNTSISTSTKVEALASIAQALYLSGAEHEWLVPEIQTFITFVQARQLPDNNCNWDISSDIITRYGGGIFSSCDDPSIRVDGLQHWINGVSAFLEYQSIIGLK